MSKFPVLVIHDFTELADALWQAKQFRNLSDEALEEVCGFTRGHVSKLLGPRREKNIGKNSLPWIMQGLGVRLVLERDIEQEIIMRSRWERRNKSQIRRYAQPLSIELVNRVKPKIFSELARRSAAARLMKLSQEKRSAIAKRAARARWKRRSKNGPIANGDHSGARHTEENASAPAGTKAASSRIARPGTVAR